MKLSGFRLISEVRGWVLDGLGMSSRVRGSGFCGLGCSMVSVIFFCFRVSGFGRVAICCSCLGTLIRTASSESLGADDEAAGIENYVLLEKIGRGSSGQVFRARRKADEKEVALKVMSAASPDIVASRRAEFEILSHLSHPNIVQGLDFFCSDSTAVIALSYHSGSTLYRAVRDSASSCLMEAYSKRLFRKLISAVSYLHEHRIVHRDVKADNILVSSDLMDLHLVDFNTARPLLEGGALTMTGTPEYAAPEVLNGESPSEQHDVWGAGLCLHWMLVGALPQRVSTDPVVFAPVTCQGMQWEAISVECRGVVQRCLTICKHERPAALLVLQLPWVEAEPQEQPRTSSDQTASRSACMIDVAPHP